ncbi:MAG TPA: AAA family ATPase, partial [Bryobacteraceae bacterium]|nr:AAA family ATPase [Bryobacteraceae bacterium]
MALPTKKTPPRANLGDYSILIYGPTKIGKTTLASQFPEALFLATEPGLNALEAYQIPITSWDGLLAAA